MTDNENDMELNSEIGGQIITDITQETEEVEPDDTEEKKVIPGKILKLEKCYFLIAYN